MPLPSLALMLALFAPGGPADVHDCIVWVEGWPAGSNLHAPAMRLVGQDAPGGPVLTLCADRLEGPAGLVRAFVAAYRNTAAGNPPLRFQTAADAPIRRFVGPNVATIGRMEDAGDGTAAIDGVVLVGTVD